MIGTAGERLIRSGDLEMERGRRRVSAGGRPVHLTPTAFELRKELAIHAGRPVTHTALLRKVKGMGYPTGLCTMSYAPETAVVLKTLDIGRYLDVVVTRDQVSKPKPDPEIYRLAASRLNVQPAECLVVEDSEPGVDSAVAALRDAEAPVGVAHQAAVRMTALTRLDQPPEGNAL